MNYETTRALLNRCAILNITMVPTLKAVRIAARRDTSHLAIARAHPIDGATKAKVLVRSALELGLIDVRKKLKGMKMERADD